MNVSRAIHSLRYFCADAWDEWRHSKAVNLMALTTLTAALFVASLVVLILANIDRGIRELQDEVRVDVYLQEGHDPMAVADLIVELETLTGVERVDHIDKEEALRRYRSWAADEAALVAEIDANPLPASLEIFFANDGSANRGATAVLERLEGSALVEEVRFRSDWLNRLEGLLGVARVGGAGIAVLILAAVVFVMAAVLRLAVYARKDEIEIMRLVGATASFIRGPFLVAGAVQGVVAAALALAMVEAVRRLAVSRVDVEAMPLAGLLAEHMLPLNLVGLIFLVGLVVSMTGSWFAVREPA